MKLDELLTEKKAIDFTKKFPFKRHKPLTKLPNYQEPHDYSKMGSVEKRDVVLQASDTGNIYGRRTVIQRKMK